MELGEYIEKLDKRYKQGITTEHSFRGDLLSLLECLLPNAEITNEPKRQKCGAPDYIVTKEDIPVGFIEAKDIGDTDLDGVKKNLNKEQFDRYKASLGNIIFTDYLRFHLYQEGVCVSQVSIGKVQNGVIIPLKDNFEIFINLIKHFSLTAGQTIKSSKRLAQLMAARARLLADIIENALNSDEIHQENSTLIDQMTAFKTVLIHDINPKSFADVYAQTIAYGLFAARLHDPTLPTFSRAEAAELIPKSNPFLRKLFGYISGPEIDDRIKWIVDSLIEIFLACNVEELLVNYGKETKTEAPIIHFYETFLTEYDAKLRKETGVWYTPHPIVNFIIRAVDEVLQEEFGLKSGLADTSKTKVRIAVQETDRRYKGNIKTIEQDVHRVQILDPATGTGTFLAEAIKEIYTKFKGQQGIWAKYVETQLIPRLNGFELLMASYAMAHLQLDLLLSETGFRFTTNQRLRIFLTNSLEESHPDTGTLFANWLSSEANEANRIKRDVPVMCVIGNPPYLGESKNKGKWIMELMEDYKKEPGGKEKLKEKNPKWLNDDYVKFIRFAQYFIEKNGSGILAYVNPHGYLDNPTFRGMRWDLLKTYDKIYIIDLHGNSNKNELNDSVSLDENVFNIQQGVSINIFIKTGLKKNSELGSVFHFDLYGRRNDKYDFLLEQSIKSINFRELSPESPNYFFVPKNMSHKKEYEEGFYIPDLFNVHNVGIVTARDAFTIHQSKEQLVKTIEEFLTLNDEAARAKFQLGKDVRDWQVSFARKDLTTNYPNKGEFTKIAYRPFDERWTFYTGKTKGFYCYPRLELMRHFLNKSNVGLALTKRIEGGRQFADAFLFNQLTQHHSLSIKEVNNIFPLYLYNTGANNLLNEPVRTPNLNSFIVTKISQKIGLSYTDEKQDNTSTFSPIDLLDYIYSVLYSPSYRKKYQELLRIDFPRIPYPKDSNCFWNFVNLGKKLRSVHLLEDEVNGVFETQYPITGTNIISDAVFTDGNIYINDLQYFSNVSEGVWNFFIGGYQPAKKWLKDRKNKELGFEEIFHYQKILRALTKTIEITKQIDDLSI